MPIDAGMGPGTTAVQMECGALPYLLHGAVARAPYAGGAAPAARCSRR